MGVTVIIPTPLRSLTKGKDVVEAEGSTVASIIESIESQFPGIKSRLLDETGALRRFVNIYVNGEDVRFLQGLGTAVNENDELSIVPAIAGG